MQVVANSSPGMNVYVQTGSAAIPTGTSPSNYSYFVKIDTTGQGEQVTIATANSSPRIDYIVAYVDKSVAGSTSVTNNTNNVFKLADVQGTPASSPSVPTVSQIQSAIGAANPYLILAKVSVAASATQITNPNITDLRSYAKVVFNNIDSSTLPTGTLAHITNTTTATITTSAGNVTMCTTNVTIPTTTRQLKVEGFFPSVTAGGAAIGTTALWNGTTSGTQLQLARMKWQDSGDQKSIYLYAIITNPIAGPATFTLSQAATANNLSVNLAATSPATLTVSLV